MASLCMTLGELSVLALRAIAFELTRLLALDEKWAKRDRTDPLFDLTRRIEGTERLLASSHRHREPTVFCELLHEGAWRAYSGSLD